MTLKKTIAITAATAAGLSVGTDKVLPPALPAYILTLEPLRDIFDEAADKLDRVWLALIAPAVRTPGAALSPCMLEVPYTRSMSLVYDFPERSVAVFFRGVAQPPAIDFDTAPKEWKTRIDEASRRLPGGCSDLLPVFKAEDPPRP